MDLDCLLKEKVLDFCSRKITLIRRLSRSDTGNREVVRSPGGRQELYRRQRLWDGKKSIDWREIQELLGSIVPGDGGSGFGSGSRRVNHK